MVSKLPTAPDDGWQSELSPRKWWKGRKTNEKPPRIRVSFVGKMRPRWKARVLYSRRENSIRTTLSRALSSRVSWKSSKVTKRGRGNDEKTVPRWGMMKKKIQFIYVNLTNCARDFPLTRSEKRCRVKKRQIVNNFQKGWCSLFAGENYIYTKILSLSLAFFFRCGIFFNARSVLWLKIVIKCFCSR